MIALGRTKILQTFIILSMVWQPLAVAKSPISVTAMVGKKVRPGIFDAACKITMIWDDGNTLRKSACSATLISKDQLITSAHCLIDESNEKLKDMFAECEALPRWVSDGKGGGKLDWDDPIFRERLPVSTASVPQKYLNEDERDVALIRLSKSAPPRIRPVPLATHEEILSFLDSARREKSAGAFCRVVGFGMSSAGKYGALRIGSVPNFYSVVIGHDSNKMFLSLESSVVTPNLQACIDQLDKLFPFDSLEGLIAFAKLLEKTPLFDSFILPGDSGGGLFCSHSEKGPWKLMGVNQGADFVRGDNKAISAKTLWAMPDRLFEEPHYEIFRK